VRRLVMSKKSSKKKPVVKKAEAKSGQELSEKELEQVAGGGGATQGKKGSHTESVSLSFAKVEIEY
jgi:bacteriocin-like protein